MNNAAKRTHTPQPLRNRAPAPDRFVQDEWRVVGNGTLVEAGPVRVQQMGLQRHRAHMTSDRTLRANAALISAAPDLLAAARLARETLICLDARLHLSLLDTLDEAIQKATTEVEE
jgi:hypothetical protein